MSLITTHFNTLVNSITFDTEYTDSETSLFLILQSILSGYHPLFQDKILLLDPPKQDTYFTNFHYHFFSKKKQLNLYSGYSIRYSLWRNHSWTSSVEIWASTSSFAIYISYSNMVPTMYYFATQWKIIPTRSQDPPQQEFI